MKQKGKKETKKKQIQLKRVYNPATFKYEPVLPQHKGPSKLRIILNWKAILILILLIFFFYALFSGWLNF